MNLTKNLTLISNLIHPRTAQKGLLIYNEVRNVAKLSLCAAHRIDHDESKSLESRHKGETQRRNLLFDEIKREQLSNRVPRIEKIEVKYKGRGLADDAVMFMNRHLSTPYHCAMHISSSVANSAVLAVVTPSDAQPNSKVTAVQAKHDGEVSATEAAQPEPILWDLHHPLQYNCSMELLRFNMDNKNQRRHQEVNKAYWRTCSVILGAIAREAFKENQKVGVLKIPEVSVENGAFCCDLILDPKMRGWKVKEEDLLFLSKVARRIVSKNLKFERLDVETELARDVFKHDEHRLHTIAEMATQQGDDEVISMYRFGEHIEVCEGPLISDTFKIFHFVVTALHKLGSNTWRMQGLSLPEELKVQHTVWSLLESRARKLVKEDLPDKVESDESDERIKTDESDDTKFNLHRYDSIENRTKIRSKSSGQWLQKEWAEPQGMIDIQRCD
uniref:TGS domain-containing protein n=1 Tax=Ciona savignyi TaxID=51511 RepID=H2YQ00_CIOSA